MKTGDKKKPAKAKRIVVREEFCIGCRLCEVYCVTQHSKSKDIIKAYKFEENRPESGIYFEESWPISFAMQCRHCDEAVCLYACPTGALYRDRKTDRVLFNSEKCIGCWMCIMVCPYGVIKPDFKNKKVASKCDMCIESEFPACVEHCPNEAIVLVNGKGKRVDKK